MDCMVGPDKADLWTVTRDICPSKAQITPPTCMHYGAKPVLTLLAVYIMTKFPRQGHAPCRLICAASSGVPQSTLWMGGCHVFITY